MSTIKTYLFIVVFTIVFSCKRNTTVDKLTAQQIVDRSIAVCGGERYPTHDVSYLFRGKHYESQNKSGKKILKRIMVTDSVTITDRKENNGFQRYFDDTLVPLPDTVATRYANAVNSVHYFSRLPYGLNDAAVKKELMEEVAIKGEVFFKVKITFEQENGGEDFGDTYLYWFQKQDFKPKYLAYAYHTNGGGIRFREAYNERYLNGIRFVDYRNFKPQKGHTIDFFKIDSLFVADQLELLSTIEPREIKVVPSR